MDEQTLAILAMIERHENALNQRDFATVRDTLALDDDRFREIGYSLSLPMGGDVISDVIIWLEQNKGYDLHSHYYDIQVFNLCETVSYVVALNEWASSEGVSNGRATLICYLCTDSVWRIIHLHRSQIPFNEQA